MKSMKPAATQMDKGLGFDGAANETPAKRSRHLNHNQWSGHLNDGRDVNFGRGPTRGNDGSCGHSGYADTGAKPPTAAVKGRPSNMDAINMGAGPRGGGRTVNTGGNHDRINVGRGPTKGNQQ